MSRRSPTGVLALTRRRGAVLLVATLALLASATATAQAWVVFSVGGLHPGQSALVAEQIFSNPNFGGLLDYEFLVANNGALPLDGFFLGVPGGGLGLAAALAGGLRYADAFVGADGPFPAVVPGGALDIPIADYYGATNRSVPRSSSSGASSSLTIRRAPHWPTWCAGSRPAHPRCHPASSRDSISSAHFRPCLEAARLTRRSPAASSESTGSIPPWV